MGLIKYISLAIVVVIGGASRFSSARSFVTRWQNLVFGLVIIIIATLDFYLTRSQFLAWSSATPAKFLVPPHAPIIYFLQYAFFRFWASHLVSLVTAVIFLLLAQYYNKKHGERFFYKEEPYYLATSLFLTGHPGWILYLFLIFLTTLLSSVIHGLSARVMKRISYCDFWLPLAAIAIIVDRILLTYWPFYLNLVFAR